MIEYNVNRVQELMDQYKLNKSDMAQIFGIRNTNTAGIYARGEGVISVERMILLCNRFEISPLSFFLKDGMPRDQIDNEEKDIKMTNTTHNKTVIMTGDGEGGVITEMMQDDRKVVEERDTLLTGLNAERQTVMSVFMACVRALESQKTADLQNQRLEDFTKYTAIIDKKNDIIDQKINEIMELRDKLARLECQLEFAKPKPYGAAPNDILRAAEPDTGG